MITLRNTLFVTLLVVVYNPLYAQKKQIILFFKDNEKRVESRDSADFIRIIEEPDSGVVNFIFSETYKDGKIKAKGIVSKFEPAPVFEGQLAQFYKNGMKESIENYDGGVRSGIAEYFFENGALRQTVEYLKPAQATDGLSKQQPRSNLTDIRRVLFQANNLGQVMVKDGNGHVIEEFIKDVPESIEEGDYKNGYKQGIWKAKNPKTDFWYKEEYEQGQLLSGESFKDGISYTYTEVESQPAFKGGMNGFYKYLGKTVRYPSDAVKSKTQGRVYLSFVVEKDGRITEVVVTKSVSPSIDAESRRVLEQSPKWIPGKQHGVPVRVLYRIPINFSFN